MLRLHGERQGGLADDNHPYARDFRGSRRNIVGEDYEGPLKFVELNDWQNMLLMRGCHCLNNE
jgi:hypothetical protein